MKLLRGQLFSVGIVALCLFVSLSTVTNVFAATEGSVGSWNTSPNTLPQGLQNSSSVTHNGFVYVLGGQTGVGTAVNTVYYAPLAANGSVGSWTASSNVLPQTVTLTTAVVYNDYVYVMSGYGISGNLSTVYYAHLNADGTVGTWTTSPSTLPQAFSNATAVVNNGFVYVMGGTTGSFLSTVYYAHLNNDGTVGAWTTSSNPLPQALVLASSVVNNGYVYVLGGFTSGSVQSTAIYYAQLNGDGSTSTWTTNPSVLTQGVYSAATTVYNGYIFQMGGFGSSSILSDVYSAPINSNASVGSWTASANSLPAARTYAASSMYNGYVYILGGAGALNTVFYSQLTGTIPPVVVPASTTSPTSPNTGFAGQDSYKSIATLVATITLPIAAGTLLYALRRYRIS